VSGSRVVVAVVGATASGKSALAVDLALTLDGEVVNADSMQLYRDLNIGTAKPTREERRGVPHHMFDVLDVSETASVAAYQSMATHVIDDIVSRGRTPIVVGGSGLYVRAVLDDLRFPGTDDEVRGRLETELASVGPQVMHDRLAGVDPAAAAAILPGNGRRIVRALEVIELTGQPFTATLPEYRYRRPAVQLGLDVPLEELDQRIETRVDRMLRAGLVAETERLVTAGLRDGPTASRALGYAQVLQYLHGQLPEPELRGEIVRATRRFARRQLSWFRRDPRINWVSTSSGAQLVREVTSLITMTRKH
jgi:tRNA dimethylallyltransferase